MALNRIGCLAVSLLLIPLPTPLADEPVSTPLDWDFHEGIDHDEMKLAKAYSEAALEFQRLSLELARRYPMPVDGLEVRRDFSRLRWRVAQSGPKRWVESIICPEDRRSVERLEGVLAQTSSRRVWIPLAIRGDRLLAPAHWQGRALLLRPDGAMIRLLALP